MIGSLYIWNNLSLYLISYLRERDIQVDHSNGTLFLPLILLGNSLFGFIGGFLEGKYGAK